MPRAFAKHDQQMPRTVPALPHKRQMPIRVLMNHDMTFYLHVHPFWSTQANEVAASFAAIAQLEAGRRGSRAQPRQRDGSLHRNDQAVLTESSGLAMKSHRTTKAHQKSGCWRKPVPLHGDALYASDARPASKTWALRLLLLTSDFAQHIIGPPFG
jgi:hypothetical protein